MSEGLRFHGDQAARPGLLDFAVNVWTAGPKPPGLDDALQAALTGASERYPDQSLARAAVARRHGRPLEEVLLLNGACDVFWLLPGALRPCHAVCVHPAFTEPEAALSAAGQPPRRVQREPGDWRLDPAVVPDDADLVVLGNPNNPTGTLDPAATIATLARPGRTLVVDESFIELTQDPAQSLAERRELAGLVVVRSLTKLYGLPGLRAGYALAPAELVAALEGQRQPWDVNALALAAISACVEDRTTPRAIASEVAAARRDLAERLSAIPHLRTWPAAANFVLAQGAPRLTDRLAGEGIAVRSAGSFPGLDPTYFRVAVRNGRDHGRLASALERATG